MKNTIAVVALSSFLAVTACKKNEKAEPVEKIETKTTEGFVVDSVKVNDSTKITDS